MGGQKLMRFEMNRTFFLLILLVSCGKNEEGVRRCYSKAEVIMSCQVNEMKRSGVDAATAKTLCQSQYFNDGCYDLEDMRD
jgi:hypothetical protein